jgi:phosphate transport system permease protein
MTSRTATTVPRVKAKQRPGDRIFSSSTYIAGSLILAILALVAGFLVLESIPAFTTDPEDIDILAGEPFWSYVAPLVFGTVWAAALALLMAVPISIGIALFISHYAPRRLAQGLGYIVDLLAAVPSVVFGLWGGGANSGNQPKFSVSQV